MDKGTGLFYYEARYYNPNVGRFIQADTLIPDPYNPQALNRYSYVLNNPLRYVDPSGLWYTPIVTTGVGIGLLAGGLFIAGVAMPAVALVATRAA